MSNAVLQYLTDNSKVLTEPWLIIILGSLVIGLICTIFSDVVEGSKIVMFPIGALCILIGITNCHAIHNNKVLHQIPDYYTCSEGEASITKEQYDYIIKNMPTEGSSVIELSNIQFNDSVGKYKILLSNDIARPKDSDNDKIKLKVYRLKDDLSEEQREQLDCPRNIAQLVSIS
ncbi:MAG: hypothetical protein E7H54_05980 [Clostridium perfringens]|nr:hypothetical protein [Clostridium perfringens]